MTLICTSGMKFAVTWIRLGLCAVTLHSFVTKASFRRGINMSELITSLRLYVSFATARATLLPQSWQLYIWTSYVLMSSWLQQSSETLNSCNDSISFSFKYVGGHLSCSSHFASPHLLISSSLPLRDKVQVTAVASGRERRLLFSGRPSTVAARLATLCCCIDPSVWIRSRPSGTDKVKASRPIWHLCFVN